MMPKRIARSLAALLALGLLAAPGLQAAGPDLSHYENFDPSLYDIEAGKIAWERGGICLQCHGWDGNNLGRNPRAPGPTPNLRETPLDAWLLREVIACGRPGTGMPHHDPLAYADGRCYGLLAEDFEPGEMPERGNTLTPREIDNLVAYLLTHVVGQGPTDLADCEAFYRPGHRNCARFQN